MLQIVEEEDVAKRKPYGLGYKAKKKIEIRIVGEDELAERKQYEFGLEAKKKIEMKRQEREDKRKRTALDISKINSLVEKI